MTHDLPKDTGPIIPIRWRVIIAVVTLVLFVGFTYLLHAPLTDASDRRGQAPARIYSDDVIQCVMDDPFLNGHSASCYAWNVTANGSRYVAWQWVSATCEFDTVRITAIPARCWPSGEVSS